MISIGPMVFLNILEFLCDKYTHCTYLLKDVRSVYLGSKYFVMCRPSADLL